MVMVLMLRLSSVHALPEVTVTVDGRSSGGIVRVEPGTSAEAVREGDRRGTRCRRWSRQRRHRRGRLHREAHVSTAVVKG